MEMLGKPKPKKEAPKLEKEKIKANIFDDDYTPNSAGEKPDGALGMDTLLANMLNKPQL